MRPITFAQTTVELPKNGASSRDAQISTASVAPPAMKTIAPRRTCALSVRCCRHERLREVGDEVVGRLDPDGEADEVLRRCERRVGRRRVSHPRGHLDHRLDATK